MIDTFLASFSIKHKLWGGFGCALLVLVLIVATTLSNTSVTQNKISYMSNDIQPTVVASMLLMNQVKQASTSLGFYLLTTEDSHKTNYEAYLSGIDKALNDLKATPIVQQNEETQNIVSQIENDVQKFHGYKNRIIELVENYDQNYVAVGFASKYLSPLNQDILQAISNMVISESNEDFSAERKELLYALQDMRYSWSSAMNNARVFLLYGNDEVLSNLNLFTDNVANLINKARGFEDLLTFEEEELLPVVEKLRNDWVAKFQELLAIHKGEAARTDALLIRTEIDPLLAKIDAKLNALVEKQRITMRETSAELIDQATATNSLVATLLVLGVSALIVISWLLARVISNPIKEAVFALNDIAEGEGDLTRRLSQEGRDEIATLGAGFNKFIGKIQELIRQVYVTTEGLTTSADEMTSATAEASNTIKQQKSETDHIASSVAEMSITSQEVLLHADAAAEANRFADKETSKGKMIVDEAIDSVHKLGDETQNLSQLMHKLGDEIQDIGSVVDVIQGITEQTNLLALNASIEAARAGEQGRGFAVVAEEVRTLATKTAQSTHEIKNHIDGIQSDAKLVLDSTAKNRDIAKTTVSLATEAGNSLDVITQTVTNATEKAEQIAAMANQQSTVAEELSRNIENITQMADQTSKAANLISEGSLKQSNLSESLAVLVSRFKI